MATTGTFTFDLNNVRDVTNYSVQLGERIVEEVADLGDVIGIAIAITIALGLIALGIVAVLGIPFLIIQKVKGFKKV